MSSENFIFIEPTGYNLFLYTDLHSAKNNSKYDFEIGILKKMVGDGKSARNINSATFCRFKENGVSKIAFLGYIESINTTQPWHEKGGKKWKNYNIYNRGNLIKVKTVDEFCEKYNLKKKDITGYNLCGRIGNKHLHIFRESIIDGFWKN
jgi:hypothetical protein